MRRAVPLILAALCIGLVVAALTEISSRDDTEPGAIATAVPSPTPAFTVPTTSEPQATAPAVTAPLATPVRSGVQTSPGPAQAGTPAPTFVPATPLATAATTADPSRRVTATGPTPRSGASAAPAGFALLALAGLVRRLTAR